ncbi:MAG TPA: hypothetical protein VMH26_06285, partial [Burkholderiales bacterium]|nr:hypothetical protein [Burkholderiales bacterium]
TPGRKTSTPKPSPAVTTTPARYARSAARGVGSSGAAGKTESPTTPARHRGLQQQITVVIPTATGPVVDHAATQRMAAGLAVNPVTPSTARSEMTSKH